MARFVLQFIKQSMAELDMGTSSKGETSHELNHLQERLTDITAYRIFINYSGQGLGIKRDRRCNCLHVAVYVFSKGDSATCVRPTDEGLCHSADKAGRRVTNSMILHKFLANERCSTWVANKVRQECINFEKTMFGERESER